MIASGKGIGNSYPVSVTALSNQVVGELENKPFKYSQSHQNDPLGAAIVNEVIRIIKADDLIPKAETKGKQFFEMLQSLKDGLKITDVRGRGLMFAMDICDETTASNLYKKLLDKGYIVCIRNALFRIDPPLTIKESEFDHFINDFKKVLKS